MLAKFFEKLSSNLNQLLKDSDEYDVIFEVGQAPNIHAFKVHSIILNTRCLYFKNKLSTVTCNDNNVKIIKQANISTEKKSMANPPNPVQQQLNPPSPPPPQQPNPGQPAQQPNAIDNLAAQIGLLIQQMQVAPAPQVNYNAPNRELNLVSYPDFLGGDQDPMTWLDKVEKAFATNLVINDLKIAMIVSHLKGAATTWWSTSQRQPQPLNELLRRIETSAQPYPDTAKAQLFLNGLRPDIVLAVAPFTPNTLQAAYERAKAYECACTQSLPYLPTLISALYSSQVAPGHISRTCRTPFVNNPSPNVPQSYVPTGQAVNNGPSPSIATYPYSNIGSTNAVASHSPNVAPNNNPNNNYNSIVGGASESQQEALQTFLALAANLNLPNTPNNLSGSNNFPNNNETNNSNNQPTFVSIPTKDIPFFASGSKHQNKRLREEDQGDLESGKEETLNQLLEKEIEQEKD
ncbi:hypothetical protein C2G38_2190490 [Gigaspora rosea]|uniref:BTB domain-containing protein n=1 Tax=Gigaspora rosea TaxID=44941 RepID=A0A397VAB7_9GLOM|nr:hypothetical protein C2G38_2190490 [Gigaspora rosea]